MIIGGIGLASARRFVSEEAHVFIAGRRQAELDAAVVSIGGSIEAVGCDVSDLKSLDRPFEAVRDRSGRIDVLFANAGGGEFVPLQAVSEEHYERTFATNVKGTLFTVQNGLPLMANGGSIILTGSTAVQARRPSESIAQARPQSAASRAAGHSTSKVRGFERTFSRSRSTSGAEAPRGIHAAVEVAAALRFASDSTPASPSALTSPGECGWL